MNILILRTQCGLAQIQLKNGLQSSRCNPLIHICRRPELNRHVRYHTRDFKSHRQIFHKSLLHRAIRNGTTIYTRFDLHQKASESTRNHHVIAIKCGLFVDLGIEKGADCSASIFVVVLLSRDYSRV